MADMSDRLTAADLEPVGAKVTLELIDGGLAVNGISHGSGVHAKLLVHLLTHAPDPAADAQSPPISTADLVPFGDGVTLELVEGDLHINGRSFGHGSYARTLLGMLRAGPDHAAAAPPTDTRSLADDPDDLFELTLRAGSPHRENQLLGEIVRFLVSADKASFAMIYGAVKTAQAAQDERFREHMRAARASRRPS
jgi:hypothetical protein